MASPKAILASLLVVALLAAGCTQPKMAETTATTSATTAAANMTTPALGTLKAAPTVLVGPSGGGAEPNIAVAPDGALYISSPLSFWRSSDGGKTWVATAARGAEGGSDGDIAVGPDGTLFWLGLFGKSGRAVPFQASRDGGESFSSAVDVSATTGADREWIDADAAGHIYTTWRGSAGGQPVLEFRASFDGGKTWEPKTVVGADGDEGPVSHDAAGRLYIADVDQAATAGLAQANVYVYTSADQGKTWKGSLVTTMPRTSPVEPNGYASDFPVVAVDGNGTAYLVFSADATGLPAGQAPPEEAARYGTYLSVSRDHGGNWTAPRLISDPSKDARFPWVAAGAAGRVAIVWYESVVGVPGEMLPDEWNVRLWESLSADGAQPMSATVILTETPNHVGAVCTSGTGCAAADRSLLDFFEVAISPAGQPLIAYSASVAGTGVGVAVQQTTVHFATLAEGPSLR